MHQPDRTAPIMVSMGDPAGIGPEIIAKAWAARHERGLPPFVAVGDCRAIRQVWDGPVQIVTDLTAGTRLFDEALSKLIEDLPRGKDAGDAATLTEGRRAGEEMIRRGWHDPV